MAERAEGGAGSPVEQLEAFLQSEGNPPQPEVREPDQGQPAPEPESEDSPEMEEEPEGSEGESEPAEAEGDAEGSPVYRVKVDGQELEVSLDELRNGYQRHADYTRKAQALAEERRGIDQQRAQMAAVHQQAIGRLDEIQGQLLTTLSQEKEPDWQKLREEDPTEYALQREARREKLELSQRIAQERQAHYEAWKHQQAPLERQQLVAKIPRWSDPEVFRREYTELGKWLIEGGYVSPEQWADTVDHRLIFLAQQAKEHHQATRARPTTEKKVKNLPRVAKPGSPRQPSRDRELRERKAIDRLRKSGSVEDAANAILAGLR